ncbi:MAG: hypothetical protein LBN21_09430 [Treponema sp.]|jgi:hypothetical protein|nr:hypothetical protein [Treponema sp.]
MKKLFFISRPAASFRRTVAVLLTGAALLLAACEHTVDPDSPNSSVPGQDQDQDPGQDHKPEQKPGDEGKPSTGSVTWFVSEPENPDEVPSGEPAGKAETLNEGLRQIRAAHKEGAFAENKRALLVIDGVITPDGEGSISNKSLVSITGAGEYPPLVIRGGEAGGMLDGQNQVRVLYVESNKVTIAEGLTLTRGNTATMNEMYGGAVYLEKANLTMTGGTISDSTAEYGSAVAVIEDGEGKHSAFKMTGGTIKGGSGSAVFIDSACLFILAGSGLITENGLDGSTKEGGGVQIAEHGIFTMAGGTIKGNRAAISGGGVQVDTNGGFFMKNGTITENTAPDNGGSAVHTARNNAIFVLEGGSIKNNHGFPEIARND